METILETYSDRLTLPCPSRTSGPPPARLSGPNQQRARDFPGQDFLKSTFPVAGSYLARLTLALHAPPAREASRYQPEAPARGSASSRSRVSIHTVRSLAPSRSRYARRTHRVTQWHQRETVGSTRCARAIVMVAAPRWMQIP